MTLMLFVAVEVSYNASIEYLIASQRVNRLKAYYAARAGVDISLLRILLYKKALVQFGDSLGDNKSMLDPIWQFPFAWPPVFPDDMSSSDKDTINAVVKESKFQGQFLATIASEGSRLDINNLGAFGEAGKGLRDATKAQLLKLFQTEIENNDDFRKKYSGYRFEELVNNMIDWVDEDSESLNGGDEKRFYPDDRTGFIPPNAPFKTIEEVHMVAGMEDDIFKVLEPRITVYGSKGININYSPAEVLKALDPRIKDDVVKAIITRRSSLEEGGPFKSEDDFYGFLAQKNVQIDYKNIPNRIPLLFGPELNFRIVSTGIFANVNREITAVTYDFDNLANIYNQLTTPPPTQQPSPPPDSNPSGSSTNPPPNTPTNAGPAKMVAPKGKPQIVYWYEN